MRGGRRKPGSIPQLPLRRYEIEKERYLAAINTAHEVFTKDVLASSVIPEEPDPDLVQATNDYNASMVEVSVRLDEALLDADKAARKFQEHADWGLGWLAVPAIVLDGVLVVLFVAYLLVLAFHLIPLWVFRDLLGLVERSEDEIQSLQFEITESQESTLNLSPLQRIGANLSRSQQRRSRDLTLPGLTARYVDYIRDVQRVFGKWSGSKKLIVCIDELDKITDPEQVGQVLREIKGGLYLENCFYLISISEDAVRAFEGRLVEQRDIFESTFDEILFLERLDLETCVAIGWARCGKKVQESLTPDELSAAQESMEIAAVLSTGVPRELLRNLRAVGNACDGVRTFNPSAAWHALFERKIWDVQKKVRTSDGLEEIRANLMDELGHYLIGGDERYDTARVASAFAEIRATQERLLKRAAETEHQADNATEEFRIHALRRQVDLLRSWVRHWMELEIHLLVWHYSLSSANSSDPTQRTSDYGKLLDIYASLPYSMAVTARRLAELDVIGPPTPLGPTRVSQAAQAASS